MYREHHHNFFVGFLISVLPKGSFILHNLFQADMFLVNFSPETCLLETNQCFISINPASHYSVLKASHRRPKTRRNSHGMLFSRCSIFIQRAIYLIFSDVRFCFLEVVSYGFVILLHSQNNAQNL